VGQDRAIEQAVAANMVQVGMGVDHQDDVLEREACQVQDSLHLFGTAGGVHQNYTCCGLEKRHIGSWARSIHQKNAGFGLKYGY